MNNITENQLLDAKGLLEVLFPETCRPSVRWVRNQQKARTIPYLKIGRLVRFDAKQVRASLDRLNVLPRARKEAAS